jgi:hypothetical protein
VPLPSPTTAEVEDLTLTVAGRLSEWLAAASEAEGNDYLDPDLAALCDAIFWSRNAPPGLRDIPVLPGMETDREEDGLRGKPLCASVAGFSLHAAQFVPAQDREALERLLRYGLRAPFSQERLSRRPDGKVVYRLRRPWPTEDGVTHLVLEPLDFLRRLAALVSFPYTHQVRRHGVFANRSRFRRLLPPPPLSRAAQEMDSLIPVATSAQEDGPVIPIESAPAATPLRKRLPWSQLLRRVLSVEALACPRCSLPTQIVPMVVLAFLTEPEVVAKILRHLGLPTVAPLLASARSSPEPLAFELGDECERGTKSENQEEMVDGHGRAPPFRAPP